MGEYARLGDKEVKIGTCENMYYLRYEDRNRVRHIPGNVRPATDLNLRFRLPLLEEDALSPGEYESGFKGVALYNYTSKEAADDVGNMQLTHPSGLLLNIPCHHGEKLPDLGDKTRAHWNGKAGHFYELIAVKNTSEGLVPIIRCRFCGQMWRCEWAEVLPHITDEKLKARLEAYSTALSA